MGFSFFRLFLVPAYLLMSRLMNFTKHLTGSMDSTSVALRSGFQWISELNRSTLFNVLDSFSGQKVIVWDPILTKRFDLVRFWIFFNVVPPGLEFSNSLVFELSC